MIVDVSAWDGGFIAIGERWPDTNLAIGVPTPLVWTSPDGREWTESEASWAANAEPRGILRLSGGGVTVIGVANRHQSVDGEGPHAAAWTSTDGLRWTEMDVPFGADATSGLNVASGPVGHVVTTTEGIWYSAEGAEWELAHAITEGVSLQQPAAGDEGFVVPAASLTGEGAPTVLASGDGTAWFEGTPAAFIGSIGPLRGDWLATGFTEDPPAISLLTSADGLDWSVDMNVDDLLPEAGPHAGPGMETEINQVTLTGEGGVLAMTMGWNHCCAQPPIGVRVFTSSDGSSWVPAGLPEDAFITAAATDGEVAVLAGYVARGATAVFWLADR
ncbi:MAG: hypothetical protein M3Y40_09140 [Chloroflexota bacterium]|nr:hypothetical protein [Chloroflexota bacterium]